MYAFRFLAAAIAVAIPTTASAQAFGVTMGAPVSKYSGRKAVGQFQFSVDVPQPNSEFESYVAYATPSTGICKISGLGISHRNDRYGSGVQSAYEALKAKLSERYGTGDSYEYLRSGALWDGTNEWVMSVKQNERTVTTYWVNKANLPRNVNGVSLKIRALDSSTAYVVVTYEFANIDRCLAQMHDVEDSGL